MPGTRQSGSSELSLALNIEIEGRDDLTNMVITGQCPRACSDALSVLTSPHGHAHRPFRRRVARVKSMAILTLRSVSTANGVPR